MTFYNAALPLRKTPVEVLSSLSSYEYIAAFDIQNWRIITFADRLIEPQNCSDIPPRPSREKSSAMPFASGYVGLIGYPQLGQSPKILWGHCDNTLGYNYLDQQWHFYGSEAFLKQLLQKIETSPPKATSPLEQNRNPAFSFEQEDFIHAIHSIQNEIKDGNVYQINLSGRLGPFAIHNPIQLWHQLNDSNPAKHAFYWQSPQNTIIGNSPELYLRLQQQKIESCPIKGTHPSPSIGKSYTNLWDSPKEEAELTMIVDMVRNDLGKICKIGSVFTEGRKIRRCGDLLHTEQRIFGTLKEDISNIQAIFSCFPAASITGAPKIAAMELIDSVEKVPRNWYTGSFGFLDDSGFGEWNVLIRSIFVEKNIGFIHIGSGIVFDSHPESEWLETLSKAKALTSQLI